MIKPMLALAMPEARTLADYATKDFCLEEKFDGHRLVLDVTQDEEGTAVTGWSRPKAGAEAGLVADVPDHIVEALDGFPAGLYDGELIVPGGRFYDVRADEHAGTHVLVLFDVLTLLGKDLKDEAYVTRRSYLEQIFATFGSPYLQLAAVWPVSQPAVDAIWARGGEGAIIKRLASRYRPGARSTDWVKVKKLGSAVLTVTGFKAGKNGPYSSIHLVDAGGIKTRVKTLNTEELAAIAVAPESYLGRRLVIEFTDRIKGRSYNNPHFDHWE